MIQYDDTVWGQGHLLGTFPSFQPHGLHWPDGVCSAIKRERSVSIRNFSNVMACDWSGGVGWSQEVAESSGKLPNLLVFFCYWCVFFTLSFCIAVCLLWKSILWTILIVSPHFTIFQRRFKSELLTYAMLLSLFITLSNVSPTVTSFLHCHHKNIDYSYFKVNKKKYIFQR